MALAQPCPPPIDAQSNHPDSVALALKQLYDQYGLCAGSKKDLLNWLMEAPQ